MRRLEKIAKREGLPLWISEGGSHTIVKIGDRTDAVPRHRSLNDITCKAIIKRMEGK